MRSIPWLRKAAFFLSCALLLAACGDEARRIGQAEEAVSAFHLALAEADFAGIWHDAAPALRAQETEAAFLARLQPRATLGRLLGSERTSAQAEGERITLRYQRFHAQG
ncbi:MAG: hypothetical protein CGU28_12580 [Candidatus Dactylopiibacterium carminicum]|uniref:Uncharacterized protein n=1 Tax=Candidatus Dactylopiibacterium carminicum TaxID=857335 RepID=A0A272EPN0_9RHOO|nr:hypothetical protein [Candidatus Dactylopiibacterium carminicum]KAF7598333.1 hypothetical protein BGI27_13855 [Candidatus Dactylopiibacterium carminicum]PAS92049.1 MAG: hypothetical protein CGU29_13260 [Candidatus Dactylopiibacterium carminicum]PAS95476.1 MAG: hypothetical protein CGU28_12580 [Candidatus Dactylopiibacterium carminicum]PAS97385.1 MAG: hypothetical protein BSR46_13880 [Candidatus Dactylopiibacterium carminicum]